MLFEKTVMFTDIHFGKKQNSIVHNQDCLDFVNFLVKQTRDIDTCIMMGDWHDNRNSLNIQTMNYSLKAIEILNENFKDVYMITGNHDLFYRNNRSLNSMEFMRTYPNVHLIKEMLIKDDCAFVPWLVEDEWSKIPEVKSKYMFGHFEIPGFKMNQHQVMPDNEKIKSKHFINQEMVFSGHFHKRQSYENIHYIGNPFGHTFNDTEDFDRGYCTLEWDKEPEFFNWEEGPRFITTSISEIVESPEKILIPKSYIRALVDINMHYNEVVDLKDLLTKEYGVRDIKLIFNQDEISRDDENAPEQDMRSVDEIVLDEIATVESVNIRPAKLTEIYNELKGINE